jgi:hypothetical protein
MSRTEVVETNETLYMFSELFPVSLTALEIFKTEVRTHCYVMCTFPRLFRYYSPAFAKIVSMYVLVYL